MSFWEKLKFKKSSTEAKSEKLKKPEENVLELVKEETPRAKKTALLKTFTGEAFRLLIRPQFSEKTNLLSSYGKYVFIVYPGANKLEIKKAVEKVYDVHVADVNMVRVLGKPRRYGRARGRTKEWKKAIVTLKAGEKIEGLAQNI